MNLHHAAVSFAVILSLLLCLTALNGCGKAPVHTDIIPPVLTATVAPTPTLEPTVTVTPTPTPIPVTPTPSLSPAPVVLNTDTDTYTLLVNRDYPLSADYTPNDLVIPDVLFSFGYADIDKAKLRKVAADALEDLFDAAFEEANLTLYGVSGYRSYDRQYTLYATYLILNGVKHTNLYSAAPGTSEHQTGLAIDVSCKAAGLALEDFFAETEEGKWLADNAHRFGFIIRYPKGMEHITGYAYEPWHIRYVGNPLATYLYEENMVLDVYYGHEPVYTLEELADTPLIDTTSDRFLAIYASYFPPEPTATPIPTVTLTPISTPSPTPTPLPNKTDENSSAEANDKPTDILDKETNQNYKDNKNDTSKNETDILDETPKEEDSTSEKKQNQKTLKKMIE